MSFCTKTVRKARKRHECYGCPQTIVAGELYTDISGVCEDEEVFYNVRYCRQCSWVRENIAMDENSEYTEDDEEIWSQDGGR